MVRTNGEIRESEKEGHCRHINLILLTEQGEKLIPYRAVHAIQLGATTPRSSCGAVSVLGIEGSNRGVVLKNHGV